jgi:hypothetical protein
VYYLPTADAPQGWRLTAAVFNWLNHPSLLTAVPTGQVWACEQSLDVNPILGISITHVVQTILASDPAYSDIFQKKVDWIGCPTCITLRSALVLESRIVQPKVEQKKNEAKNTCITRSWSLRRLMTLRTMPYL